MKSGTSPLTTADDLRSFWRGNYRQLQEIVLSACDTTDVLHDIYIYANTRIEKGGTIENPIAYFKRAIWVNLRSNTAPYRYADKKWERCKLVIEEEVNDPRWEQIENAMQGLTKLDALILELRYFYDETKTDLANIMGADSRTVDHILDRATEQLKKMV